MKKFTKQALTTLLAILLLLAVLTGCGAKAASYDYAVAEEAAAEAPMEEPAAAEEAIYEEPEYESYDLKTNAEAAPEEEAAVGDEAQEEAAEAPQNLLAEKIIYSAYVHIETTEFDKALKSIDDMVKEYGGFIQSSEINGNTRTNADGTTSVENRNAYYVLRVPSSKFNDCLNRSGTIGSVLSSNTVADNITSQFTDAEARKSSLAVQEERLLAMMEKSEDVETLVELENRLADVRYEIESLERQLINWQRSVDYSTVKLNVDEVEIYTPVLPVTPTFGERLNKAFADGWNGFKDFGKRLILWFARSLPTLVILAILAVAAFFIVRKIKRRVTAKKIPYARVMPTEDKPADENK